MFAPATLIVSAAVLALSERCLGWKHLFFFVRILQHGGVLLGGYKYNMLECMTFCWDRASIIGFTHFFLGYGSRPSHGKASSVYLYSGHRGI